MNGNFSYCNPTKLYFGKNALSFLPEELKKYGKNVVLIYGGGSIKRNGLYDEIIKILKDCGKNVVEDVFTLQPSKCLFFQGISGST